MGWEEKDINFIQVEDNVWHITDLARTRIANNNLDRKLKRYHIAILYTIMNLGGIADIDEISSETGVGVEKVAGSLVRLKEMGYVSEIASGKILTKEEKDMVYGGKPVSPARETVAARNAPNFVNDPSIPQKVNERVEVAKAYSAV